MIPRGCSYPHIATHRTGASRAEGTLKIYLIAPRNPESFWTFDRVLPSLNKQCIYPNLSLPTVAGLTPREHDIVLCDENAEEVDFDTDADIVGVTGYVIQKKRIFEIIDEFRRRGKFVVVGGPFASLCPEELRGQARRPLRRRGRVHLAAVPARLRRRAPGRRSTIEDEKPTCPTRRCRASIC